MHPGDMILFRARTPQDYGQHHPRGSWRHVWVHWVPRIEVLEWLNWPELSPGLCHLHVPPELRGMVRKELVFAASTLRTGVSRGEELALNGLERALLICSRINPRRGGPRWHPRIQEAADYLGRNLRQRLPIGETAQRFGFSRSRFALLFRQQVGQPPAGFVDAQRLAQTRQLLAHTNQTLAQIAEQVGYSSSYHLSLRFKRHFGHSPRAFRQQKRRIFAG